MQPSGANVGKTIIRERDVDRVMSVCDSSARHEYARRGRVQMLDEEIAPRMAWLDSMLERGANLSDLYLERESLARLVNERDELKLTPAEVVRLQRLGIEPEWHAAARARIAEQEEAGLTTISLLRASRPSRELR